MNASLPESLQGTDLKRIVDDLERGECNLLLGTDVDVVAADGARHNLVRELGHHLAELLDTAPDRRATLPSIAQDFFQMQGEEALRDEAAAFLTSRETVIGPECILDTLAKLPFRIIVTSRHDHTLDDYLRAAGKEPFVRSWDIFKPRVPKLPRDDEITTDRPLVFYLCGETDDPDSLILTEDHVIKLVRNVTKRQPSVPHYLQEKIKANRSLLVGFGVPKWHTRVILEELGKKANKRKRSFAFGEFEAFVRAGDERRRDRPRVADLEAARFHLKKFDITTVIGDTRKNLEAILDLWTERASESEDEQPIDGTLPYVFISYCHEDEEHAEALYRVLTAKGIQCFWDKKGLRAGQAWMARLSEEITKMSAFVLLVSNNLAKRELQGSVVFEEAWKAREVNRQRNLKQFLMPVFVDDRTDAFDLAGDGDLTFPSIHHARVVNDEQREALADTILEAHRTRSRSVGP